MQDLATHERLAEELFRMVAAARAKGVNLTHGFRNHVLESPALAITYLFLPRTELLRVSALPAALRRFVRSINALACLEGRRVQGRRPTLGVHLLWASTTPLARLKDPAQVRSALVLPGVAAYVAQLRTLLRAGIDAGEAHQHRNKKENSDDAIE